jgi:subtilisin family serine protease
MHRYTRLFAIAVFVFVNLFITTQAFAGNPNPNAKPAAAVRGKLIPNRYIVTLKPGQQVRAVAAIAKIEPDMIFTDALNGFVATLTPAQAHALGRNPAVAAVEQDQEVTLDATQTMDSNGDPWGLDRIDQRALPLSRTYTYNNTGAGVRVYVIDTGLQANHPDFGTRAQNVYDAFGGSGADCQGHGTHVGGTIAGATYGVAKGAYVRGVKVLDCSGSGSTSGIIGAVDWVRKNAIKPAVANMSLGGGYSSALNTAVTNLANSGVFVAVAAGNEGQNACNVSPASASGTYTVAAADKTDTRASFSNYGSCVDGYAPGVAIKSAWINSSTNTISGTSMASPHVAGVATLYKARYGDTASSTIVSWINSNATSNVIKSNPTGTPNRLLNTGGL